MNDRELLEQALEALEIEQGAHAYLQLGKAEHIEEAITALRERLAQPEFDSALQSAAMTQTAPKLAQPEPSPLDRMAENARELGLDYEPVQEHDLADRRCECCGYMTYHREHMGCIRAAKQPEQEPVQHTKKYVTEQRPVGEIVQAFADLTAVSIPVMPPVGTKLYTTPPRREWKGLTQEEADALRLATGYAAGLDRFTTIALAIEAKLREKNA